MGGGGSRCKLTGEEIWVREEEVEKGATMAFYDPNVRHAWPHSSAFGACVRQ
jgi:hypothetical protein